MLSAAPRKKTNKIAVVDIIELVPSVFEPAFYRKITHNCLPQSSKPGAFGPITAMTAIPRDPGDLTGVSPRSTSRLCNGPGARCFRVDPPSRARLQPDHPRAGHTSRSVPIRPVLPAAEMLRRKSWARLRV